MGARLESAPTAEARQELKKDLEAILEKQQAIKAFLAGKESSAEPERGGLEADLQMLQEKETEIRREIEKTDDPARQADLKAALTKVMEKEAKVMEKEAQRKAEEAAGDTREKLQMEKLKQEYTKLEQKKQDVKAMLEKTEDPQKKAEFEDILKKIDQKQEQIRAEAVKVKVEAEKTVQEERKK